MDQAAKHRCNVHACCIFVWLTYTYTCIKFDLPLVLLVTIHSNCVLSIFLCNCI